MHKTIAVFVIFIVLAAIVIYLAPMEYLSLYLNPAGLALVLGGTLAGIIIAYPLNTLFSLGRQIRHLRHGSHDPEELVHTFMQLSELKRKQGVREVETLARRSGNLFLALGVGMVADNRSLSEIRQRLDQEIDMFISKREAEISILSLMGRLAPAFGLAGTVFGLIRMLHGLSDPNLVASGMSEALLTTFYGIMLANLIVLPLERKLRESLRHEAVEMTVISEGIMGLALDENRAVIAGRLRSYRFAPLPETAPESLAKMSISGN
jgi:chemotaxis protein MotA